MVIPNKLKMKAHPYRHELSSGEAGRICQVSTQTILNWCHIGRLKYSQLPSGHHRIPRSEVRALLEKCGMTVPLELLQESK